MKTIKESEKKTIVAFHIGRGGHYHNQGHLSYKGQKDIGSFVEDLFLNFENTQDIAKRLKRESDDFNRNDFFTLLENENFAEIEKKYNVGEDDFGEKIYTDCNGHPVGLTETEEESGIGRINIDEYYDTTYTCYLEDCDDKELDLIDDDDLFEEEDEDED